MKNWPVKCGLFSLSWGMMILYIYIFGILMNYIQKNILRYFMIHYYNHIFCVYRMKHEVLPTSLRVNKNTTLYDETKPMKLTNPEVNEMS